MATLINYNILNPFMRKVTDAVNYIKTDKIWYKDVKEKAKKRNISVDSMLTLDAIWAIEQDLNKN
jgi:hypothetical protein